MLGGIVAAVYERAFMVAVYVGARAIMAAIYAGAIVAAV